ncbi:MAG: hypothetical protein FJ147_01215 [Deltaproteobacteria bacterium]|nr:hypothetical protein [Deltaproteobacteria bacterium]
MATIVFAALCFFLCATGQTFAQGISPDVRPTPLVRLTGVLELVKEAPPSAFPVLRVWIDERPHVFRVSHVEAVFSAYRAQEQIRRVPGLGLRFLAEKKELRLLQAPEMHDRPIVIEGWLQPKRGILRVRSVKATEP